MRKVLLGAVAATSLMATSLLTAGIAQAADSDVSFASTVALQTAYLSRGVNIGRTEPQLNITAEAVHASGIAGGVWYATTDLDADFDSFDWEHEIAPYVYFSKTFDAFSFYADAYYYIYAGDAAPSSLDYLEFSVAGTYDFGPAQLKGQVFWSPDYFGETGDAWYKQVRLTVPASEAVSFYGWVGHQTVETTKVDQYDYALGVIFTTEIANLELQYNRVEEDVDKGDGNFAIRVSRSFSF
jgi:uncharacterized protein (TIGR02001 family)